MVQAATSASTFGPFGTIKEGVMLCCDAHTANSMSVEGRPYFVVGHLSSFITFFSCVGVFDCLQVICAECAK